MTAGDLKFVPTPFNFKSVLGDVTNITKVEVLHPLGITRPDCANVLLYSGDTMIGAFYPTTEVQIF